MNKKIVTLAIIAVTISAAIIACTGTTGNEKTTADTAAKDSAAIRIKHGEYLVSVIGCDDCHSPKKMGPNGPEVISELRLSGFPKEGKLPETDTKSVQKGWALFAPDLTATVGQWGISYAANITPDQTGLGNWKEENFLRAIREGKSKGLEGSRPLLPPMPWYNYKNMTDEDLKSIFAYLKTIKPVNNVVPAPVAFANIK
ncbi:MAG: c-type cytochrome [Bacteroidota bacterium]